MIAVVIADEEMMFVVERSSYNELDIAQSLLGQRGIVVTL